MCVCVRTRISHTNTATETLMQRGYMSKPQHAGLITYVKQLKLQSQSQLQLAEVSAVWQLLQHMHYLVWFREFTNAQGL